MSILLNDTLSQHLVRTSSIPALTFPFAIQCAVKLDDLSVDQCLVGLSNTSSSGNYHALLFDGSSPSNTVTARSRSAGSSGDAVSSSGIGSIKWSIVLGLWISDAERYVYLDGANVGSNTDSRTVTGLDSLAAGILNTSSPSLYMSGQLASIAIWSDLPTGGLTPVEVVQLGALKITPLLIKPDKLIMYAPLPAATPNPAIDVIGSYDLALIGAPTTGDDDPGLETFAPPYLDPPPIGFIQRTIQQTCAAQQSIVANIHGGPLSSTAPNQHTIAHNVIIATLSNAAACTQLLGDNVLEDSLASTATASGAISSNVIQDVLFSTPEALDLMTNNVKSRFMSSAPAATQSMTNNVIQDSLANTCAASSSMGRIIDLELFSNAPALQSMFDNCIDYPPIVHECTATQTMAVNVEYNISIEQVCPAEGNIYRTIEDTLSNTCTASNEIARGEDPSNTATADQTLAGSTCKYISNECSAVGTITATIERSLTLDNTCAATGTIHGYVCLDKCELHQYMPQGASVLPAVSLGTSPSITLVCGSDTITLHNPEFGNTDDLDIVRALNRSRHGSFSTYRNPIWPKSQVKSFTITNLKEADAQDLLDFKLNCLGKEITYTDMEARDWIGTIVNPQDPISADGNDRFSVSFEFRGVLTTEKTW